jgi:hypothetical protein
MLREVGHIVVNQIVVHQVLMCKWTWGGMIGAYIECGGKAETSSGILPKHGFEQRA